MLNALKNEGKTAPARRQRRKASTGTARKPKRPANDRGTIIGVKKSKTRRLAFSPTKVDVRVAKNGKEYIFSRGEIVDSKALRAWLDAGATGKYICDFPDDDLHDHPNVQLVQGMQAAVKIQVVRPGDDPQGPGLPGHGLQVDHDLDAAVLQFTIVTTITMPGMVVRGIVAAGVSF